MAPAAPSQSSTAGLAGPSTGPSTGPTNGSPTGSSNGSNPLSGETAGPMDPLASLPPTGTFSQTVISSGSNGQAPSQEVDACASTAFSGTMGHTNAISDERSSNGRAAPASSDPPSGAAPQLPRVVSCQTKTVSHTPINYNIPNTEPATAPSFKGPASQQNPKSTQNPGEGAATASSTSLSSSKAQTAFPSRRQGWGVTLGGGLRGGAPLPGETSAISNGTTGWGPPPSGQNSVSSAGAGWGTPSSQQSAASAWGAPDSGGQ